MYKSHIKFSHSTAEILGQTLPPRAPLSQLNLSARFWSIAILVGLLSGCAHMVGPDYERPQLVVADRWHQELVDGMTEGEAAYQSWWLGLGDPALVSLIERAQLQNLDLKLAAARISEARATLGIATGGRMPDVNGSGFALRTRISEGILSVDLPPLDRPDTIRDISVGASWEIDLWGRVRRSIEAATASYEASLENHRDVQVVLSSVVGRSYIQLRTLQQRLLFARANVELQRETLALVEARNLAELAPDLEVRQAEFNLAITEAALPDLEAAILKTINLLSTLLGEQPGALHQELQKPSPIPGLPASVPTGIPAEVIRQRPDLRAAERVLAAQTALVGVATTALYPNFFLHGDFGYATAVGGLFNGGNEAWSLGPFFSWNLFDGGRVRNAIHVEEAKTEQALIAYERTVLNALQDVEGSLIGFAKERERQAALQRGADAAAEADLLVRELYRQGLTNFQNVLDTQRSLFSQQDRLAESSGAVVLELISIYRSLGGGW